MQPLRCAHLLLLTLLTMLVLCLPFGLAQDNSTVIDGIQGQSPALLPLTLGLAAAFLLRLC